MQEELIQGIVENMAKCQRPGAGGWQKLGVSHGQASMLYLLAYHGQSSVKQVSEYLGVSKSAVSQLVDPLVDKDLIIRRPDENDRRIAQLSLSPAGARFLKKLARHKFAGLRTALESLSPDELKSLHRIYKKMAKNSK